jgi:hypothetical protein
MKTINWLKALWNRLFGKKVMAPIEAHIRNLSVATAIEDLAYQLIEDGQILMPDFLVPLDQVRTRHGTAFNLKDPAIKAFFDCLDFEEGVIPSEGDLMVAICEAMQNMGTPEAYSQLPVIKHLASTRAGDGWAELDSLLVHLFGYRLSKFFNDVEIFYHPEDTADVGEKCYRVRVEHSSQDWGSWSVGGVDSWSAAASNLEYALRMVDGLLVGSINVAKPEDQDCEPIFESIQVFHGDVELLSAIIAPEFDAEGERVQKTPLRIDGHASQLHSDRTLLQNIAQYAPSFDLCFLKGRMLEDSLGL